MHAQWRTETYLLYCKWRLLTLASSLWRFIWGVSATRPSRGSTPDFWCSPCLSNPSACVHNNFKRSFILSSVWFMREMSKAASQETELTHEICFSNAFGNTPIYSTAQKCSIIFQKHQQLYLFFIIFFYSYHPIFLTNTAENKTAEWNVHLIHF